MEALLGAYFCSGLTNRPGLGGGCGELHFMLRLSVGGCSGDRERTVGNVQGPVVGSALQEPGLMTRRGTNGKDKWTTNSLGISHLCLDM